MYLSRDLLSLTTTAVPQLQLSGCAVHPRLEMQPVGDLTVDDGANTHQSWNTVDFPLRF